MNQSHNIRISYSYASHISPVPENRLGRDATSPMSLIISSFDPYPFTTDGVYSVLDAAGIVANNITKTNPLEIITGVTWPNEVEYVDASILGKRMLAVPGGFLVPWKSTGGIWLIDISEFDPSSNNNPTLKPIKITQDKSGWFYHRVRFYDVNGDGRQGSSFFLVVDSRFAR
jgi:hypothetical protein